MLTLTLHDVTDLTFNERFNTLAQVVKSY
jgi:hypothetical protein